MTRTWQPNGSNFDYWRSDNPLIQGWWRCGDNGRPKNNFLTPEEQGSTNYLSGLLVDSGPQKHHLKPYFIGAADNEVLVPTSGIAPWALSGSGIQFRWLNIADNKTVIADPSLIFEADTDFNESHGTLTFGNPMYSGFTAIAWVKITDENPANTIERTIFGRDNQDGAGGAGTRLMWRLTWARSGSDYQLLGTVLSEANYVFPATTQVCQAGIKSSAAIFLPVGANQEITVSPNFPRNRNLPFFVAMQVRRENVESNRQFTSNGSGNITVYVGTQQSGIIATATMFFRGTDIVNNFISPDLTGVPFSIGASSRPIDNATSNRHLASGSIIDEIVYVADGYLNNDRILHYALSGIRYIEADDPISSGFVPQYPGTSGLVAFWGFDSNNGANTAPDTMNDPRLFLSLSGSATAQSFVPGYGITASASGSALRVTPTNTITNTSDGATLLASKEYPAIPAQSGLALLFPSGHVMDEGMTIIGWVRSVPTGNNMGGGGFGWLGAGGRQNAFFFESVDAGVTTNRNVLSVSARASGTGASPMPNVRVVSFESLAANNRPGNALGLTNSATQTVPEFDNGDTDWHLWAGVYDIKAGQMYMVRDAKRIIQMTQQISSASGFMSDGLGVNQGFFGFFPVVGTRSVEFDSMAVYNRILSIPEISGYGLLDIRNPLPPTPLNVSQKNVVGYWPLDGLTNYDPTGISGSRVNDSSWYFHHLTNISGSFSTTTRLNTELLSVANSLQSNTSGARIGLERVFHGANLDASLPTLFSLSGMSAGTWIFLPSGDLNTQGRGSSGLFGDHMIMGAWGPNSSDRSWYLGVRDNKFLLKVFDSSTTQWDFQSDVTVPFNRSFFVGANIFPSGGALKGQVVYALDDEKIAVGYALDVNFSSSSIMPQACGPSGFSLLNVNESNEGFPQTTKIGTAFVNLGYLSYDQWLDVKRSSVDNNILASGAVSSSDPFNVSFWRMQNAGTTVDDNGKEQNALTLINVDGHTLGRVRAIHGSGTVIRVPEYLDTLPFNANTRRLDLGSGTASWTFLGWFIPNADATVDPDLRFLMNKGIGYNTATNSGVAVYTPRDSLQLVAEASGITTQGNNGNLAPGQWNHLAVVYDRDNNQFTTIINGRYAGTTLQQLVSIPTNASGMSIGGRGSQVLDALTGGGSFSGVVDDVMVFARALTLPEISGLAANSYSYAESPNAPVSASFGGYISGIANQIVSGLIGAYMHGMAQDLALYGGYVSGVSGQVGQHGGYIYGAGQVSGLFGGYLFGIGQLSGIYGGFLHGIGIQSGVIGSWIMGAGEALSEFDIVFNFQIVAAKDFDSKLQIVKSSNYNFDAAITIFHITAPPECVMINPPIGLVVSGLPYTLTASASGWALENKDLSKVRFTFADFKPGTSGTLVGGTQNSGLFQATRTFDTPGWYTVKLELMDSYGYRHSCIRPFLLLPSGSTSGAYLASLPGISISGTPKSGFTTQRVVFTHSLSGLSTTSGLLEYTDFADQQETLLNSLEVPTDSQFTQFVRIHDYPVPGTYSPVWAVSGGWGIISDSIADGIDYRS